MLERLWGCTISEGARWELCLSGEAADARVGSGSGRRSLIERSPSSPLSMLRGPSAGNDQKKMVVLRYGAPQPACFPEIALGFRPERCRGHAGHMRGEGDATCEYGPPTRTRGFNDSVKFSLTCFLCVVIAVCLCVCVCGWVCRVNIVDLYLDEEGRISLVGRLGGGENTTLQEPAQPNPSSKSSHPDTSHYQFVFRPNQ